MTMLAIMKNRGDGVLTGAGRLDHRTYLEKAAKAVGREIEITEVEVDNGPYREYRTKGKNKLVRKGGVVTYWAWEGEMMPTTKEVTDKDTDETHTVDVPIKFKDAAAVKAFIKALHEKGLFLSYGHKLWFPGEKNGLTGIPMCQKLETYVPRASALVVKELPQPKIESEAGPEIVDADDALAFLGL